MFLIKICKNAMFSASKNIFNEREALDSYAENLLLRQPNIYLVWYIPHNIVHTVAAAA